jgi:hypothetical protein
MIEALLEVDPAYRTLLEGPIPMDGTPEARFYSERPQSSEAASRRRFVEEFDDSLGGRSGMTNLTAHETQSPSAQSMGKVYVVPNPLIVTNGLGGSDPNGEVTDRLQFYGLTKHCTIRIFSYSGQLVQTLRHDVDAINNPWYQISRNNQLLASGIYYFVVEDDGVAGLKLDMFDSAQHRKGHCPEVDRKVIALSDRLPVPVEQSAGKVLSFQHLYVPHHLSLTAIPVEGG